MHRPEAFPWWKMVPEFKIEVSILKDVTTICMIDTSGSSLFKRVIVLKKVVLNKGNMAAAILQLSKLVSR